MKPYLALCRHILENGKVKEDRTGTGTISTFGYQMRFDLSEGFPLVTTKKVHLKSIIHELLWFLKGSTNNQDLEDVGVTIWREWARENGDLGPIYGRQWRSWPTIRWTGGEYTHDPEFDVVDQVAWVIEEIKRNPHSRRLIVSAWNVGELPDMALNPCHVLFQFYVQDGKLSCQLYQRSGDTFLGIPFNIASYSLLTMMIAQVTDLEPGEFIHTIGDAHIYLNHMEQVKLQLTRDPKPLPKMILNPGIQHIDDFTYEDFLLEGYECHPAIKGEVAI